MNKYFNLFGHHCVVSLVTFSLPGISFKPAFWNLLELHLLACFYFKYFTEDLLGLQSIFRCDILILGTCCKFKI